MTAQIIDFTAAKEKRATYEACYILTQSKPQPCPVCESMCMVQWCNAITLAVGYRCEAWPHKGGDKTRRWQVKKDGQIVMGWSK